VIQLTPLDAVHAQPDPAVTFTVPFPPEAGTVSLVGVIENVQAAP
jgi:hypothetical protein